MSDLTTRTRALIDTGAPRNVFPRGIGDLLAVEFPSRDAQASKSFRLLGRTWPAVTETVTLSLHPDDDLVWEAEVDFVLHDGLDFAILGYEGFLNRWAVTFNGAYGYFVIEAGDDQAEQQDPALLSELARRWPGLT